MQKKQQSKTNVKIVITKFVLFAFILILLYLYSHRESDNQDFILVNTAFLYEGNQLIGVNIEENADNLVSAQKLRANEVLEDIKDQTTNTSLSTKVVSTPSIINFNLTDDEQINNIDYAKQKTKVLEKGYTLTIDDNYKFYLQDEDTLSWTVDKILLAYLPDQSYLDYYNITNSFKEYTVDDKLFTSIKINNNIKLTEGYQTGSVYVESKEDLLFELFHYEQNRNYAIISDSKSLKAIQDENELSTVNFKLNNPNLTENTVVYNGQQVVINELQPILEVVQTFETTEQNTIEYETVQEVDESLLTGQFEVETEGKEGTKEVTYENQMINGEVVSTDKISEEVIEKPVHKVILVGENSVQNTVTVEGNTSTNGFESSTASASSSGMIWPSSSKRVTCEIGCYAGHTGIDIQSYYGGPIYAAQSGMVITSGWSNIGYGYYVVIDHGGGVKTLYAHQSQQPPVSVGQYVEQGQVIGFEGATGNVTGEHLHFEVQINGTAVNPRGYIS